MTVVPSGRAWSLRLFVLPLLLVAAACHPSPSANGSGQVPPPPTTPHQSLGPSTPPVSWLSGTLNDASIDSFRLEQGDGALVTVERLGSTKLYRVSGDTWTQQAGQAPVRAGEDACIETLLDGSNLVALRVFLGAGCGPI